MADVKRNLCLQSIWFCFLLFKSSIQKEEKLYTNLETSCMAYLTRSTNGRHTSKTKRCFTVNSVLNPNLIRTNAELYQ